MASEIHNVRELAERLAEPSRILIVDDDPSVCNVLEQCVKRLGCSVKSVQTGEAAIEAASSEPFSGVLLDIRMPTIDGFGVLKALKQKSVDVPVIVLTGYPEEKVYKLMETYGVLAVLSKPVLCDELTESLQRYFRIFRLRCGGTTAE